MFFDRLKHLCNQRGISPYRACTDIGLNRSAVAKWKAGSVPNGTTAAKLAVYFGVTTDYLLDEEDAIAAAQRPIRPDITDEEVKFALFGGDSEITDEMYAEVRSFADFVKRREAMKKK